MAGPNDMFWADLNRKSTSIALHRNLCGRYPNENRARKTIQRGQEMEEEMVARDEGRRQLLADGTVIISPPGTNPPTDPPTPPTPEAPKPITLDDVKNVITSVLDSKVL